MISKTKIKYIRSLESKKARKAENVFVAEGAKAVGDILQHIEAKIIVATKDWINPYPAKCSEVYEVTDDELTRVSLLQHPQQVLAVFPQKHIDKPIDLSTTLALALDDVQDPGNLGTIIRIADWFGITQIYCGTNTVDVYNNKVVQATMGSIARVNVVYTDLYNLITSLPDSIPVYGTFLDGENIYEQRLSSNGLIVVGNEGNGISNILKEKINRRLLIPNYPQERQSADSLNVAIATAITCGEFRRQSLNI